jgi:adenylate cyclase
VIELPSNLLDGQLVKVAQILQKKIGIYGDGINIAARLEGLTEPGGICISKTAFDHIETKLPSGYHYLGEQTVKKIENC